MKENSLFPLQVTASRVGNHTRRVDDQSAINGMMAMHILYLVCTGGEKHAMLVERRLVVNI